MIPKKYPRNIHTPKIFIFLKTPKNIEIQNFGIHDNSSKDTSSNTTFGRIRQLVGCNVWSKWTVGLNLYFVEMCLNLSKTGRKYQIFIKEKTEGKQLYFEFCRQVFGHFFIQDSAGPGDSCVLEPGHRLLHFNFRYVRSMHIVACLL